MKRLFTLLTISIAFFMLTGCLPRSSAEPSSSVAANVMSTSVKPASSAAVSASSPSVTSSPAGSGYFYGPVKPDASTLEANLANNQQGKIFCYKGDIYFSQGGIFRMNADGGDLKKISDRYAYYLNVYDDRIYFAEHEKIFRLNTDGSGETLLYSDANNVGWLKYDKGTLYFTAGDQLKKLSAGGGDAITLLEAGVSSFISMYEGNIYYCSVKPLQGTGSIWRYDPLTGSNMCLLDNISNLYGIVISDDLIYYCTRVIEIGSSKSTVYSLPVTGGTPNVILTLPELIMQLNIDEDYLYILRTKDNARKVITALRLNGNGTETAVKPAAKYTFYSEKFNKNEEDIGDIMGLSIAGKWMFYDNVTGHNAYLTMLEMGGLK